MRKAGSGVARGKRVALGTIRVGPVDYAVYEVRGLRGSEMQCVAAVRYDPSEMLLDATMGEQYRTLAMWHEIIHAIVRHAGHEDLPEPVIEALAYGIVGVLRDNRGHPLLGGCGGGGPRSA